MGRITRVVVVLAGLALLAPASGGAVVGAGTTFDDTIVSWDAPVAAAPVQTATDRAGNLYSVWSDGHHVWEKHSSDGGTTWSDPERVDVGPGTAILPVVVAGDAGHVAVAYLKTPYANGDADASTFPVDAVWWVALAEDTSTLAGHVFAENRATSAVHYGAAPGIAPGLAIAANGLAVITYASDQFDPVEVGPAQCDAATANTAACLHTMQAVQTSGPRLVSPPAARGVKAAKKTLRHRRR